MSIQLCETISPSATVVVPIRRAVVPVRTMSRASVFRSSALRCNLITPEQIEAAQIALRRDWGTPAAVVVEITDEQLAEKLVALGWLTRYQADQLLEGRTKLDLGPYMITDFIGQGGMGQVFKAEHKMMGRIVAVKVLPKSRSNPESIANFAREIRTQARLDHPNLVRAYDAGRDGNVYYLVTEYVPGTDLRRLVRTQGKLSMQQAAAVITQAALGLQHAHDSGLIHRDVKPGNILVTPDSVAKVSDLGLAGFTDESESDPRAGKVVGTADYMSPEQIRSPREITPVADIYSLGCTLYYAITGKVPFPGGTIGEKCRRHCEETPWHPRKFNPDVTEDFVEIVADMMEKDPQKRIRSCAEVVQRLEPWAIEAVPLPTYQLIRSRWMPPPPPTGRDEEEEETDGDGDPKASDFPGVDQRSNEQGSQISQPTPSLHSPFADTSLSVGAGQMLPSGMGFGDGTEPAFTSTFLLSVVVPLSMLGGAILTLFIEWLVKR